MIITEFHKKNFSYFFYNFIKNIKYKNKFTKPLYILKLFTHIQPLHQQLLTWQDLLQFLPSF